MATGRRISIILVFIGAVSAAQSSYSTCQQQLIQAINGNSAWGISNMYNFIDTDTPGTACQVQLCTGNSDSCNLLINPSPQKDPLYLVFSDEFNTDNRQFSVKSGDKRWTAEDIYYFPTQDVEVYKPEQVMTWNGHAVITIEAVDRPTSAISLQPDGAQWSIFKNYKSGMVNSWNKWCFTGGYMEMSVFLPGDNRISGFWPAFWAMGNLGRAGYMPSTKGLWPYSYDQCLFINKTDGSQTYFNSSQTIYYETLCAEHTCVPYIPVPGSKVPPQIFSACPKNQSDPNYIDREKYGMKWNTSRNAPEFDVFEIIVNSGSGASASQTLQMAPLLPTGQDWSNLSYYDIYKIQPPGVTYPGGPSFLNTQHNGWSGIYGRPGNEYQDSMSAVSLLNDSFYSGFHTFGLDWAPGEYLRWYVDGIFAYEINPTSLLPRSGVMGNQTYNIGQRMIPEEPMYMIFNLGMSQDFGVVDIANLQFPSYMLVDYVRVYQRPDKITNDSLGCSPPKYPTAQWISCNRANYMTNPDDSVLFTTPCSSGMRLKPGLALISLFGAISAALAMLNLA